ncbi:integrator complex subunit 6-B [Xenopus laevis]|uniref:Integrator complex subunit 6-B n=2 Tax=Xenopus laevis TaxID=8355 RepID=INT6B_XENLA|nr:integrator complex subunit 6-B [Xenopus laevis]Q5U4W6.1 RecName: Full=Integrator complex subunit 6-B; Short=Int6-B [Xenopus laevis]AAH84927.1 LOC495417 protein [Xenopus laevis]
MPILLFLLDTSASMNQRSHLGTTYLDIAKGAVETFMKLRSRDPASRGDRYMLVTLEELPYGIKAGWKENHATFMNELKNLQAVGLTTLGQSLRTAFDLLNLNRLVTGIDNYGQGRNPFFLEPSIIVAITDGSKLTTANGVQDELHLPLNSPLPGSELTKEPFRWDQRLFALVLRLPGATAVEQEQPTAVQFDESPITAMCDVTGGRSYSVTSQRILNQCLESLVQKIQSGVVINFEKSGPDPPILEDGLTDPVRSVGSQPWHSCHKLIYVRPNPKTGVPIGHWPIPESFWPDQNSPTLPPRTSHPVVKFSCTDSEPLVIDKLPFDKYELEPSPLTQFILERKSPHTCWPVFVPNSAKYCELGHPFGYLKASTALNCVNLFVLPYNYPVLLPLLDDLFKMHKNKPPLKWRQPFENYLKTMPPYYIGPLKKALRMMGTPNLMPDSMEYGLSYSVVSYLKKLSQQAKVESDRVIGSIGKKYPQETSIKVRSGSNALSLALRKDFKQLLQEITGEVPQRPMDLNMKEFAGFQIALLNKDIKPQTFRNAYDIPRTNLLDHLTRMRANLLKSTRQFLKGQDEDQAHSIPIVQMGNYQEYLKHIPSPLRELDYDQPRRLHTFGNPFKLDKKGMMIDEADEFVSGNQNKLKRTGEPNMQGVPKRRRCMSPLLHSRPQSPSVINNHISGKDSPVSVNQVLCDLPKPVAVHKNTDMSNNVAINEATENHVADHLCDDLLITKSESFGTLPNAALEASESYAAGGDSNFSPNDTSDVLLDKTRESGDTESCLLNNNTAFVHRKRRLHQCRSYEEANIELKAQILKEIRKPGRKYGIIFTLLKDVQGDLQTRLLFLQHVIKEATRFKKRMLIEQLEGFLEEIHRRTNQVNHLSSC